MAATADMLFEISLAAGRYADPRSLARFNNRTYSQNGEDGVIAEIFSRIGVRDRYFVEIGVENGQQNNTRLLLEQGWRGVWVDGNEAAAGEAAITFAEYIASGALKLMPAMVFSANIDAILDAAEVPSAFDFLSLDVDQNTSHVWRALTRRARVVCIEYTASLPSSTALEVPYEPNYVWDGSNWCGASLKAIELIGRGKQLSLVGCELRGVNAFLVASEETQDLFRGPFTAEEHWEPARYDDSGSYGHPPSGKARQWVSRAS